MRVHSAGGWVISGIVLLLVLWQLFQALFFGRMADILDDDEDYVFFFENPGLFIVQFVVLAGIGFAFLTFVRKEYRKYQREKLDTALRHTHDARRPRKDR